MCNLQELWDEVVFFSVNVYVYAAINTAVDHFLNPPLLPPPSTITHRFNSSSIQHFNFLCTPSTTTHCSSIVDAMRIYLGKLQRCLFSYVTSSFFLSDFIFVYLLFSLFSSSHHLHQVNSFSLNSFTINPFCWLFETLTLLGLCFLRFKIESLFG